MPSLEPEKIGWVTHSHGIPIDDPSLGPFPNKGRGATWNHRITRQVRHFTTGGKKRRETIYSMREVYYDKNGEHDGYTMNAKALDGHRSPKSVIECLEMMLRDAKRAPVLTIEDSHEGDPCAYCGRGFEEKSK